MRFCGGYDCGPSPHNVLPSRGAKSNYFFHSSVSVQKMKYFKLKTTFYLPL